MHLRLLASLPTFLGEAFDFCILARAARFVGADSLVSSYMEMDYEPISAVGEELHRASSPSLVEATWRESARRRDWLTEAMAFATRFS